MKAPPTMTTLPTPAEHTLLEEMFSAAVAAARPGAAQIAAHLPPLPKGRIVVVGAGHWRGEGMALVEAVG